MSIPSRLLRLASALLAGCAAAPIPGGGLPSVDIAEPVRGVPDHGDDPAVVLVQSANGPPCAGVLLAADVVLTAWHCTGISGSSSASFRCPDVMAASGDPASTPPSSVRVLVGVDAASAVERARARAIVAPAPSDDLCLADVALLLLDQSIDDIAPLLVQATGAAQGGHVRTVGFQPAGSDMVATRFLKDHVPVVATSPTVLGVFESECGGGCGGPALDESTGDVVGVASRWVPSDVASAAGDDYTRADAFLGLVGQALARSTAAATSASSTSLQRAHKGPPDMGSNCAGGADCAAGACVSDGALRYCTRRCSPGDPCPTHFRCADTTSGSTVCVED
jgi:trypsin-like peptidase